MNPNLNINNMSNLNIMSMNNLNMNMNSNQNINTFNQQQIYLNLCNNNFKNPPNYINGFNINNCKISQNNKNILEEILKVTKFTLITPLEIIYKEQHGIFTNTTKEREKCPICLCEFYDDIIDDNTQNLQLKKMDVYIDHEIDVVKLLKCEDHFYHIECLSGYIKNKESGFKCAVCQKIYGVIMGNMTIGTMKAYLSKQIKWAGFYNESTIIIDYSFKSGKLYNGQYYSGTSRRSYLPNNKEGRIILALLKIAFDRKLTFVVGTSVTTGQKYNVVWNGIHHKTSTSGGATNYGYPDPTYFSRVTEELASKGVNKLDFDENELEKIANNLINSHY